VNVLKLTTVTGALLSAVLVAGCGEVSRNGRAPVQVVIVVLEGAPGAEPDRFGNTLRSDVSTRIDRPDDQGGAYFGVYNDLGRVTMRLLLRDPGVPGVAATPSDLNAVTFNRYRVTYTRADGRNTPGTDVPYPFDSAATFTVSGTSDTAASFDLVRHTAKQEAPLMALRANAVIISTIAEVSFYGRDQVGNEVIATGNLGIFFGDFADPQ
jgi:hypothetical protein